MEEIVNGSKEPERSKYYNVLQLLEDYKDELEVKMEEYMIYQQKHPDMKDYPEYNYKNLEFVLRASNPKRYSQANASITAKKQETMKILENKSKVKLNDPD